MRAPGSLRQKASPSSAVVIYVPALRGCVSQGETEDEALENIRDAILTWHATWQDVAAERKGVVRQVEVAV